MMFRGIKTSLNFTIKPKIYFFDNVTIDFCKNTWFEANLSAVLGAILSNLQDDLNTVALINFSEKVEDILTRNNFLNHFGGSGDARNSGGTVVPYKKFGSVDTRSFEHYLRKDLFGNPSLSSIKEGLTKKVQESILEVFMNAQTHGNCKSIFSCGQLFPQKNRLDFTIVNMGTTIKRNVSDFTDDPSLSSIDAIEWAIVESNTTRKGAIPGGLGLSTLTSFIELNGGTIQIISDDGYYLRKTSSIYRKKKLNHLFDGTIVNIEFDINDATWYSVPIRKLREERV